MTMNKVDWDDARTVRHLRKAWQSLYSYHAGKFLSSLEPGAAFTGEDLRAYIEPRIDAPHHPNCWGSAAGKLLPVWKRRRQIYIAGMRAMKSGKAHGRHTPVYRKREDLFERAIRWLRETFG
jgi:hypothetical protein